jgi:hypothetical protein
MHPITPIDLVNYLHSIHCKIQTIEKDCVIAIMSNELCRPITLQFHRKSSGFLLTAWSWPHMKPARIVEHNLRLKSMPDVVLAITCTIQKVEHTVTEDLFS